jgi:hypothetical protein
VEPNPAAEFEKAAQTQGDGNVLVEFWLFLAANKKWWLLPILIILLLFTLLAVLTSTGAGPFLYTLF